MLINLVSHDLKQKYWTEGWTRQIRQQFYVLFLLLCVHLITFNLHVCRRLKSLRSLEPKTSVCKRWSCPNMDAVTRQRSLFLIGVYLSAAVGGQVAFLLISPLPADFFGRVLALSPRTMAGKTSDGPAILYIPCAVSASLFTTIQQSQHTLFMFHCIYRSLVRFIL